MVYMNKFIYFPPPKPQKVLLWCLFFRWKQLTHHSARLIVTVVDQIVDPPNFSSLLHHSLALATPVGQMVVPRPSREWQCASSQPKPWGSLVDLFLLSALVFLTSPLEQHPGLIQKDEMRVSRSPRQPAHLQQEAELQVPVVWVTCFTRISSFLDQPRRWGQH